MNRPAPPITFKREPPDDREVPLPSAPPTCRAQTTPKNPTLRFMMFRDIEAQPRKAYVVDGLLGEGEMSAFAGAPGSGKSVLAGDLSCHAASGKDWMGRRVREPVAVLYIAAERSKLTERRFAAWRKRNGIDDLPLAVVSGSVDFLHSRAHVDEAVAWAKHLTELTGVKVGMIVIDTVSRTLAGGDENGPKDMGAYVANVAALQEATGAHVLLLHHVPQGDGAVRLRGHGALLGAVDTMVTIEKSGELRVATVAKENDGPEGETMAFTLESVELHVAEDGFITTAPVVVPAGEQLLGSKRKADRPRRLTNAGKTALRALTKALAEVGEPAPPSNHVPRGVRVVTVQQWRTYAYTMGISDSSEDRARQQAFKRAFEALLADQHIATWSELCWPTGPSTR